MIAEQLLRHADIIGGDLLKTPILVVGAGAIGSWTVMTLSRIGFNNIAVIDFDLVTEVNLGAQGYSMADAKKKKLKTDALYDQVLANSGIAIRTYACSIAEAAEKFNVFHTRVIVISAADSMEARKFAFNRSLKTNTVKYFLDARMGAEFGQIFNIAMDNIVRTKDYSNSLFTDAQAAELPCMAKSTAYCALAMSGILVSAVVNDLKGTIYKHYYKLDLAQGVFNAY